MRRTNDSQPGPDRGRPLYPAAAGHDPSRFARGDDDDPDDDDDDPDDDDLEDDNAFDDDAADDDAADDDDDLEDDPALDEDFPRGDGTADTEADVTCPYCGETNTIALDPGSGSHQAYVQDCEVCCNPWQCFVEYDEEGAAHVSVIPLEQ
jgi:hypothetical protein